MNVLMKRGCDRMLMTFLRSRLQCRTSFTLGGLQSRQTYCTLYNCRIMSTAFPPNGRDRKWPSSLSVVSSSSIRPFSSGLVSTLSEAPPILAIQDFLIRIHDVSGLPWWAVIVLTTCLARTAITLPLAVYQNHILGRYANLKPEIEEMAKQLNIETAVAAKKFGWSQRQAKYAFKRSIRKIVQGLIVRDNCHPFKASIVLWFQIPLWMSISFALRNLVSMLPAPDLAAHVVFLSLSGQGVLWIPNLTIPDASLILPVTLGLTNLLITQIHSLKTLKMTGLQKGITYFLYAASMVSVPIAATVPSCVSLYWTTSSLLGLFQNLLLMSPTFRHISRIPSVTGVNNSPTPYRDLLKEFKNKFNRHTHENERNK